MNNRDKIEKYKIVCIVFGAFFLFSTILSIITFAIISEIHILDRRYTIANIESFAYDYRDSYGNFLYDRIKISYSVNDVIYEGKLNYNDDLLKIIDADKIVVFYDKTNPSIVETDFLIIYPLIMGVTCFGLYKYFDKKGEIIIT